MINKFIFYSLLLFAAMIIFSSQIASAQNRNALEQDEETIQTNNQTKRPSLLKELDLTPDQVQQIRQLNQASKAQRQAANRRLKAANDALDEAIYSDVERNDAEIQARIREVHAARLEVLKNRVASDQGVRRVLTPQQLGRFRELKRQYNQNNQLRNQNNAGNIINRNPNRALTPRQQIRLQRQQNRQRRLSQ